MKLGMREFTFLVVLAAVPLAAWFFVFEPRNDDIEHARREIAAMEDTLSRLDRLTSEVGDVRGAISLAEARLADFRRYIPDEEEVAVLLNDLDRMANDSSLKLPGIRRVNESDVQGHLEIPLTMEAEGSFASVYGFLLALERLPRIVRVQELELERNPTRGRRDEESRRPGDLDVSMTVLVYCEGEVDR